MTLPDPPPNPRARLEAVVHGRVQGVGFRFFVLREAAHRRLDGWVANEAGGGVRCVAQGARRDLEAFAQALADGPPGASVSRVDLVWSEPLDSPAGFTIRSGWHDGD
jgi:acylphosphatase